MNLPLLAPGLSCAHLLELIPARLLSTAMTSFLRVRPSSPDSPLSSGSPPPPSCASWPTSSACGSGSPGGPTARAAIHQPHASTSLPSSEFYRNDQITIYLFVILQSILMCSFTRDYVWITIFKKKHWQYFFMILSKFLNVFFYIWSCLNNFEE